MALKFLPNPASSSSFLGISRFPSGPIQLSSWTIINTSFDPKLPKRCHEFVSILTWHPAAGNILKTFWACRLLPEVPGSFSRPLPGWEKSTLRPWRPCRGVVITKTDLRFIFRNLADIKHRPYRVMIPRALLDHRCRNTFQSRRMKDIIDPWSYGQRELVV